MPLRLFASIFPSLYSSLYKHLLIDRNLSQLVALLTCASHSSLVLMSSTLAGGDWDWCNQGSERSLFTQKKTPNVKPIASWITSPLAGEKKCKSLLKSAAISYFHGLFLGFAVKKGCVCGVHMYYHLSCETPRSSNTSTLWARCRAGQQETLDIQ